MIDYAPLYQSHLIFGLLEATTEEKIPERVLLRHTTAGALVVSSHNLSLILRKWWSHIPEMRKQDIGALQRWSERVQATLEQAQALLMIKIPRPDRSPFRIAGVQRDVVSGIIYAVAAIGEAVTSSRRQFLLPIMKGLDWRFILNRIVESVYCSHSRAERVRTRIREYLQAVHPRERGTGTQPVHYGSVYAGCTCQYSRPSLDAAVSALSNGQIPVIAISYLNLTVDVPKMICSTVTDTPYVAVSHVWVDG
ncbi:hypothetical protein SCP_1400930 [Sparassis crispa]|uniref:Uncharacterized protein n=1 Tax=Sparassis crispa TaxID=139825 RepID=A0A401H2Q6_9APHY|nr:hypothetical protein SCP_1400930 [Sparassis crispa]GBE88688.1 hypothetical protein SCP_1400930 [Sparassis crispa]